jgi:hypothetical protein
MKIITLFSMCFCAWAQSGIGRPQLGKMLDSGGAVRTVYGITSSVTLGGAESTGVLSLACSNAFCLAKTESNLVSATGSVSAPAGRALFAFGGNTAYIWFPQTRQLASWQNGILTFLDATVDGEVLSIGAAGGAVQFIVRSRSGVWIANQDGSLAGSLPHAAVAATFIPGGVVYATEREIVIRNIEFPLTGVTSFSQMSDSYFEVRAGGVDYALRTDQGRETLFQLPGASQ